MITVVEREYSDHQETMATDITLTTKLYRWIHLCFGPDLPQIGLAEHLEHADGLCGATRRILARDGDTFFFRRECLLECAPDILIEITEADGDPSIQVLGEIRGRLTDPWFGCLDAGAVEAYGVRRLVVRASGTQEDTPALFDQLRDVLANSNGTGSCRI